MNSVTSYIQNSRIAKYADVIATFVLLVISYFVKPEDSLFIAGIAAILLSGRLITLALVQEQFQPFQSKIEELEKIIDVSGSTDVRNLKILIDNYVSIVDGDFAKLKENIVSEATDKLRTISFGKTSDELSRGDYYSWLLPILERTSKEQFIRAVSIMADAEWDDSPEEERFINGNLAAARKGAQVERIFIVRKDQKLRFSELEQVKYHYHDLPPSNLFGFIIEYERLQQIDPILLKHAGNGFIDFNGEVALVDNFGSGGEVRGYVTKNAADLKKLSETFEKLKNMARTITKQQN